MVQTKYTYGCGQLLPGAGVYNFPDYVPSPGVDVPSPPGTRPDPTEVEPTPGVVRRGDLGGNPGGGGPGRPRGPDDDGPATGDPSGTTGNGPATGGGGNNGRGPTTGIGNPRYCFPDKLKSKEESKSGTSQSIPGYELTIVRVVLTFSQKCVEYPPIDNPTFVPGTNISQYAVTLSPDFANIYDPESGFIKPPNVEANCSTDFDPLKVTFNGSNSSELFKPCPPATFCPDLVIKYSYTLICKKETEVGPITGSGPGIGGGGTGGGGNGPVTGGPASTGPTTGAGPGVTTGPGTGGGGGGGGGGPFVPRGGPGTGGGIESPGCACVPTGDFVTTEQEIPTNQPSLSFPKKKCKKITHTFKQVCKQLNLDGTAPSPGKVWKALSETIQGLQNKQNYKVVYGEGCGCVEKKCEDAVQSYETCDVEYEAPVTGGDLSGGTFGTPPEEGGEGGPITGGPSTGGPFAEGRLGLPGEGGGSQQPRPEGPTTGGPSVTGGGPAAPPKPCNCTPYGEGDTKDVTPPSSGGNGPNCKVYETTFKQFCRAVDENFNPQEPGQQFKDLSSLISKVTNSKLRSITFGEGCECQDKCDDAKIKYEICNPDPFDPDPPGPLKPKGSSGNGGGTGQMQVSLQQDQAKNENSLISKINLGLRKTFRQVSSLGSKIFDVQNLFSNIEEANNLVLRDPEVAIQKGIPSRRYVRNTVGFDSIFSDAIHESLFSILSNNGTFNDWNSRSLNALDFPNLLGSINQNLFFSLKEIRKPNGNKLSNNEIANIVYQRIIDNSLDSLDIGKLKRLAKDTQTYAKAQIQPSPNMAENEIAVLALIENNLIPLVPKSFGRSVKIMENWKTFATDLDKYVEIEIAGVTQKYYIRDDDTVVDGLSYTISDGDFLTVFIGGQRQRFPVKSEKERGFILPEPIRQQALSTLGADANRKLYCEVDASSNIEFNYSLNLDNSSPRQNVYFFKLVPSATVKTSDTNKSDFIVTTDGKYELMDSTTQEGIDEINDYIKYKYNHRSVFLSHDDILFDYIEATSSINMVQNDILVPQAKINKEFPLLVRDYPWYLIVVPTNRPDYLIFNNKSSITSYNQNTKSRREISISPSLDPKFTESNAAIFTQTKMSINQINVSGSPDTQSRTTTFSVSAPVFTSVYRDTDGSYGVPSSISLKRNKTTFRLTKEIIEELDSNYVLGTNPRDKSIYPFDLFSRLNQTEFNKFFIQENGNYLYSLLKQGIFNDVKIVSTTNTGATGASSKTRSIKRRSAAPTIDKFPIIKSTNEGRYLQPPGDAFYSSTFGGRSNRDISSRAISSRNT